MAQGKAAFGDNCVACHGVGGGGAKGFPNLNDDDWLWGGSLEAIQQTLQHGIRATTDTDTRVSMMPAFGKDGTLKRDESSRWRTMCANWPAFRPSRRRTSPRAARSSPTTAPPVTATPARAIRNWVRPT